MSWMDTLFHPASPVLPALVAERLYLGLAWGLVLACAGLWLALQLVPRRAILAWCLAGLCLLWSCWPGPASPAYWLGLAFRAPSLASAVLCLLWLWQQYKGGQGRESVYAATRIQMLGLVLGWLLLLDTFAVWPISLYALGFQPLLLGAVTIAAVLPWVLLGGRMAWLACGVGSVLLLFVLSRLPSGNLWDALLDPWLWAGLHLSLARRLRVKAWRASAATRA